MPKRIQRKRTKGWRMPPNTVYVGRPTKWGNPFTVEEGIMTPEEAVMCYGIYRLREVRPYLGELRGKDVACWCPLDAEWCHGDLLLRVANR